MKNVKELTLKNVLMRKEEKCIKIGGRERERSKGWKRERSDLQMRFAPSVIRMQMNAGSSIRVTKYWTCSKWVLS